MRIENTESMMSALRNTASGESRVEREPDGDKDDKVSAATKSVRPEASPLPEGMGNSVNILV